MIDIKPQHTFLAFWIIQYPAEAMMDMMGTIWRDGDTGEYLGRYRYRYYDPLDPENDAYSGKDSKQWYKTKFDTRPDVTKIKEAMMRLAEAVGGILLWTDEERSGEQMAAFLVTCPWTHTRTNH